MNEDPLQRIGRVVRYALLLSGVFTSTVELLAQDCPAVDGVTYEVCSGAFYDSGGSSGPYDNGEHITTTICPEGGPGSGFQTSVSFTQWAIAPGPGDQLFIHDGTEALGPPLIVAGASTSMVGQSFISTHPSGCLTFRWVSDGGGVAAGWTASITTGPDAGEDVVVTFCSSDTPAGLFGLLDGTPDTGGSWTDPDGAPHSGTFDPALDEAGDYTYLVSGAGSCPDATATVTVAVVQARDAGADAAYTVCGNAPPFTMRSRLGGTPEPGGTWTGPLGGPHSPSFDPSQDQTGAYTYTLAGQSPCPDAGAVLTITVQGAPSAGTNAAIDLCSDDGSVDLFTVLGGVPDP